MKLLYALQEIRNPALDAVLQLVTRLGEETVFMVVAIVVFWCISKKGGYYLLSVGFLGTVVNQWLKIVFRIPRPWVLDPNFQIVDQAHADHLVHIHLRELVAQQHGHQAHAPAVLGHALVASAGGVGVAGHVLQPLYGVEDLQKFGGFHGGDSFFVLFFNITRRGPRRKPLVRRGEI